MTTPRRYRRKPDNIEAVQWNALDGWDGALTLAEWCGGLACRDEMAGQQDKTYYWSLSVPTLEGHVYARPGDWIIRGEDGVFRVAREDRFAANYELAE